MKEKNTYSADIEVPEGVSLELKTNQILVKGPKGELIKAFDKKALDIKSENNKLIIKSKEGGKRYKKVIFTTVAHIKNMIAGVQEGFTYRLKICSGHFPMNISVSNGEFIINNLFGEKIPRVLKIKDGAEVKIDGDIVTVTANSKELCGQVAADIERLSDRKNFDKRIFQDGIYIIEKAGKPIK